MAYADLPALTPAIALEHHINHDLSGGYPVLQEPRPPCVLSLIVSLADAYDALTTARPYRPAYTPYQAMGEMRPTSKSAFRFSSWKSM